MRIFLSFHIHQHYIICGAKFMKLYTIDIAIEELKRSSYINSLTGQSKIKTLDRHNYLIHLILKNHVKNSTNHKLYTNIHSKELKDTLGRDYKTIVDNLTSLGLIDENKNFKAGGFSKSYRLNPELFIHGKIQEIDVKSKWLESKLNDSIKLHVKKSLDNLVLRKILQNTTKLYLIDEPFKFTPERAFIKTSTYQINSKAPKINFGIYLSNPNRLFRYEEFRKALFNLNSYSDIEKLVLENAYYEPSIASSGRIYHMVASIPRKIRKGLRTKDNKPIYEVDMASAQPSILMLEWLRLTKNNSDHLERKNCLELVINGGIYNHIKRNSKYYHDLEYKELKKQVLTALNCKSSLIKPVKELSKVFPSFISWINHTKEKFGHQHVSLIGQSKEADIFVEVYKNLPDNIFALIIHDCILTTEEHLALVKSRLQKRVKMLYKEVLPIDATLEKLFKTERVSFPDNELSNKNWMRYVCSDQFIKEEFMEDEYYSNNTYEPLE